MSIADEHLSLFTDIAKRITLPPIKKIYLPELVERTEIKDEFGFVILKDDSAGAFYVSLEGTLEQLKSRLSNKKEVNQDCLALIKNFNQDSIAMNALAFGAYNAVSHHVMRRSGFTPADRKKQDASSTGISQPVAGERIGMIGYFAPLIDRLLEKNIEVLIIEKVPDRFVAQKGLLLSENISDLATCQHILCTASTLINDTLDDVLKHCTTAKTFSLIGPSGSILPDILFKHGVDAVGGFYVNDVNALHKAYKERESWGLAGNKYQLTAENYPGIEFLLDR